MSILVTFVNSCEWICPRAGAGADKFYIYGYPIDASIEVNTYFVPTSMQRPRGKSTSMAYFKDDTAPAILKHKREISKRLDNL